MRQVTTCGFAALAIICVILMAAGCTDHAEDTIQTEVKPQEAARKQKEMARQQAEIERLRDQQLNLEQNWTKLHVGLTPSEVEKLIGPFGKDDFQWDMVQQAALFTAVLSTRPQDSGESMAVYRGQRFKLVFINGKLKSWDSEFYVKSPTVQPALKLAPEDRITYKVTTDRERGVLWEGPLKNKPRSFVGGHSGNKIELTFTRQTQSVDDEGSTVVKITINALKYLAKVKDNIVLDFDSSREKDRDNPLNKLIGQSYTIELTASGEVSNVIDVNDARAAVAGSTRNNARATQLLSIQAITEQHSIPALPAVKNEQLIPGKTWSDIKTFSFGPMGSKSFERIYEIKQISETDGRQIAVAQMNAVPSAAKAKELYKEQSTGVFSSLFDNTETYTGELRLDLASGQIEKYTEEFRSDWIAVDPLATKQEKEPDMLRMSATRIHRIERID